MPPRTRSWVVRSTRGSSGAQELGAVTEPGAHDLDRLLALVDEDEAAAELAGGRPGRAAAREEVEHPVARSTGCGEDAAEDAERLLGRVARLLGPGRRHDRVPPHVGRQLAARGLLRRDETGRH